MKGNRRSFSPSVVVSEYGFRLPSATSKISAVILENVFPLFFFGSRKYTTSLSGCELNLINPQLSTDCLPGLTGV